MKKSVTFILNEKQRKITLNFVFLALFPNLVGKDWLAVSQKNNNRKYNIHRCISKKQSRMLSI